MCLSENASLSSFECRIGNTTVFHAFPLQAIDDVVSLALSRLQVVPQIPEHVRSAETQATLLCPPVQLLCHSCDSNVSKTVDPLQLSIGVFVEGEARGGGSGGHCHMAFRVVANVCVILPTLRARIAWWNVSWTATSCRHTCPSMEIVRMTSSRLP